MDPRLCFPIMAGGASLMGAGAEHPPRPDRRGRPSDRARARRSAAFPRCWSPPSSSSRCRSNYLRWLVFVVVLYAAAVMARASMKGRREEQGRSATRRCGRAGAVVMTRPATRSTGSSSDTTRCARRTPIAWPKHESDAFDEDYEIATLDFAPFLHGDARREGALRRGVRGGAAGDRLRGPDRPRRRYRALRRRCTTTCSSCSPRPRSTEKMRFRAARHGSVSQGYFPIEETSEIHPDLVEGWVWCRRAFDIPQERDAPFRPRISGRAPNMSRSSAARPGPRSRCSSRSRRRCSRGSAATRMSMTASSPDQFRPAARTTIRR